LRSRPTRRPTLGSLSKRPLLLKRRDFSFNPDYWVASAPGTWGLTDFTTQCQKDPTTTLGALVFYNVFTESVSASYWAVARQRTRRRTHSGVSDVVAGTSTAASPPFLATLTPKPKGAPMRVRESVMFAPPSCPTANTSQPAAVPYVNDVDAFRLTFDSSEDAVRFADLWRRFASKSSPKSALQKP
jgi:hypothetical protein